MGYFNIFYKITRIIDMLTRKRNRKAIMVILIIIAVIFIFKTKVQANESLEYNVNYYMKLSRDFDATGQITFVNGSDSNGNYNKYCYVFPVYAGYTYNIKWTANAFANIGFQSDLSGINLTSGTSYNIGTILAYTDTKDFTYTCNQDGYLFIGSSVLKDYYYPSGLIDGDLNLNITTDYDGTSNYTALHNDLLRIETLLKDYLYGDAEQYSVSTKNLKGLWFTASDSTFKEDTTLNPHVMTRYFKVKKNYSYKISWAYGTNIGNTGFPRFCYSANIPAINGAISDVATFGNNSGQITSGTYTYTATNDGYLCMLYRDDIFLSVTITSNYNEGQEYGLYGGLTNIQDETQYQGEQTRETITSTEYNQSDVNIDTDTFDNIDTSNTDGLFTTIFTNFNNAARGGVDSITIPMPHDSGNLVLYSNVVSSHLGALASLVSAFWYFVFGFYAFKFVNNLLHSIKNGNILDGFKSSSEVITQDML